MLRKRQDLSRLKRLRENRSERYSCSAQRKQVGKRGSGNTGVGYRQRVSRSSWTRRTGGRSRPIRQESGKSPPKKSTADDGCRRGDKAPYVPDETCARCLLVLRALGGSLVGRMARRGVLLPIRNSGAFWWFCWLRRRLVRGAASTGQRGLTRRRIGRAYVDALPLARDRRQPPGFIRPALPVLATKVPAGDGWPHELKHDG